MEDDGDAPNGYVVNAYFMNSDFGKMRAPDVKSWLGICSDEIHKTKP